MSQSLILTEYTSISVYDIYNIWQQTWWGWYLWTSLEPLEWCDTLTWGRLLGARTATTNLDVSNIDISNTLDIQSKIQKHCFNVNEPISAHRTLSASLHCDYVSVLTAMECKFTPSCFNWSKIWDLHLKFMSYMNITYVPTCISTQFSAVLYSGGIFFSWRIILSRTEGLMMGWKIKK